MFRQSSSYYFFGFTFTDLQAIVHIVLLRVDRVLGFFLSRPNWDPPLLTCRRVCTPLWFSGGHICLRDRGRGVPIRTRGKIHWGTLAVYVLCCVVLQQGCFLPLAILTWPPSHTTWYCHEHLIVYIKQPPLKMITVDHRVQSSNVCFLAYIQSWG